MAISQKEEDTETQIELVLDKMWKFNQTYKLFTEKLTDEEREPIWYVMDEFGSSIRHNDTPKVQVVPFYYVGEKAMFSIMFPLTDLNNGGNLL